MCQFNYDVLIANLATLGISVGMSNLDQENSEQIYFYWKSHSKSDTENIILGAAKGCIIMSEIKGLDLKKKKKLGLP